MSRIMLLSLSWCLLWGTDAVVLRDIVQQGTVGDMVQQGTVGDMVRQGTVGDMVRRSAVSLNLNDMFREVEELMEDTRHLLEDAVDQITTESARSSGTSQDLQTHSRTDTKDGDNREMKNKTAELRLPQLQMSGHWNTADHDCVVDEDCADLQYCLYEMQDSRCLPCIPTDMPCRKDEECCSDQLCVWGQCSLNVTRGTEGTICQDQSDCRTRLCCAFQPELLFPVCNPKPEKGESCLNHPNLLMDLLAWDQEGPRDHCPCADSLRCQPHGRGSVCAE